MQAIAHLSGSCFFDLSPRNTDGTYPGKAVAMLLHLVFKVGADWCCSHPFWALPLHSVQTSTVKHCFPLRCCEVSGCV